MTKGKRDNSHFLFLLILAGLSALAIWFVEEERPRRERAQSGMAVQTATARAVRLATTRARQTATTWAALTAAASYRTQIAGTATAQTPTAQVQSRQTAVARERATVQARWTAVYARRTAIISVRRTATVRARRWATTRPRTAVAREHTAAAQARATAARARRTDVARQTATAQVRPTDIARQTAAAQARQTDIAQRSFARQTATARSQYTDTPTVTPTPATSLYRIDYASGRVNIRECPRLSCSVAFQLNHGAEIDGLRIVEGDAVRDEARWLEFNHQERKLYVHLSLVEPVDGRGLDTASVQTVSNTPTASPRPTATSVFTATPPLGRYYVRNPGSGVNVRACPRLDCDVLTRWDSGRGLEVRAYVAGDAVNGNTHWVETRHSGQVAYVHSSLVTRTRPTNTPRPTPTLRPWSLSVDEPLDTPGPSERIWVHISNGSQNIRVSAGATFSVAQIDLVVYVDGPWDYQSFCNEKAIKADEILPLYICVQGVNHLKDRVTQVSAAVHNHFANMTLFRCFYDETRGSTDVYFCRR